MNGHSLTRLRKKKEPTWIQINQKEWKPITRLGVNLIDYFPPIVRETYWPSFRFKNSLGIFKWKITRYSRFVNLLLVVKHETAGWRKRIILLKGVKHLVENIWDSQILWWRELKLVCDSWSCFERFKICWLVLFLEFHLEIYKQQINAWTGKTGDNKYSVQKVQATYILRFGNVW